MKVGTDAMLLGSMVYAADPESILDIGSGTGVLALMMAQRFPKAQIEAVEVDEIAVEECRLNFDSSPWADRLTIYQEDILCFQEGEYDLIVSNPPYYQNTLENEDSRKARARHSAHLPPSHLLCKIAELLSEEGTAWLIVPREDSEQWMQRANDLGLHCKTHVGIFGKEVQDQAIRSILSFARQNCEARHSQFIIRNSEGGYTNEYIELTKEFHHSEL